MLFYICFIDKLLTFLSIFPIIKVLQGFCEVLSINAREGKPHSDVELRLFSM